MISKPTQKILFFVLRQSTAVLLAFLIAFSPVFPALSPTSSLTEDVGHVAAAIKRVLTQTRLADFSTRGGGGKINLQDEWGSVTREASEAVSMFTKGEHTNLVGASSVAASTATDSLVSYWKMDEGTDNSCSSGEDVCDSSGSDNHGTGTNWDSDEWVTGTTSINFTNPYSLDFDGTDDIVTLPDGTYGSTIFPLTFSAWIKIDTMDRRGGILRAETSAGTNVVTFSLTPEGGNNITAEGGMDTSSFVYESNLNSLTAGPWYHVLFTHTGAASNAAATWYINGVAQNSPRFEFTGGSSYLTGDGNWKMGDSEANNRFFDGQLDDVRIYNRVLSSTEISDLAGGDHTAATWDGSSSTDWETAANWDINAVPDNYTDVVIADTSNDPELGAAVEVAGLTINSSALLDLASYDLTFNDSGTFVNNGTLRLQGSETLTGFTNDTDTGTVDYDGSGTYASGLVAGDAYNNLTFSGSGSWTLDAALDVNATLALAAGTLDLNGQGLTNTGGSFVNNATLRLQGGETLTGFTNDTDTGTVDYDGSGTYASGLVAGDAYNNLTFSGSGSWTLDAALDVNGDLILSAGTLDVSATDYAITLGGNWTKTGGSFTEQEGTVTLDGVDQTVSGDTTFYNLSKTEGADDTTDEILTFTAGDTFTITNTWTLDGRDSDDRINLVSSSPSTQWNIDPQGTRTLDNIEVTDSNNTNSTFINEYADSTVVSGGNNDGWIFSTDSGFTWMGTINSNWSEDANWLGGTAPGASDTAIFSGASVVDATIDTSITVAGIDINSGYTGTITQGTGNTITLGSSGYNQADGTFTGGDSDIEITPTTSAGFILSGGTFTSTTANLEFLGGTEGAVFTHTAGGTFDANGGTLALNGTKSITFDVNTSETFNNMIVNLFNTGNQSLTIASGDTLVTNGALTLSNGRIGPGTLNAKGSITVNGTYTDSPGSGTLLIDGASAQSFTIPDGAGMPAITLNQAATTIDFAASANVSIGPITLQAGTFTSTNGTLTLIGDENVPFNITGGTFNHNSGTFVVTAKNLDVDVNTSVTFNNFTYNPTTGSQTLDITAGDTVIVLGTLTLGAADAGGDSCDNGALEARGNVVINTGTGAGSCTLSFTGTNNQTYTDNGGNEPDGDITINKTSGTVTLASNADWNATNQDVTITDGTLDVSGYTLATGTLTVTDTLQLQGDTDTLSTTTTTRNAGHTISYTGDGDSLTDTYVITDFFTDYENLAFNSTDGATDIFQTNGDITVGGNWTNNTGTFDPTTNTNTVTFDGSTSSGTITETTNFYNLAFNGSGAWDAQQNMTIDNNLTLTAGTFDINGSDLTVTGTYSNPGGTLRLLGTETVSLTNDTNSGTVAYDNTATLTDFPANLDDQYYSVSFTGTGLVQLAADLDANGNLTIGSGAELDLNGFDLTIGGNFVNSGTLTNHSGRTISLDGTTQTFNPSNMTLAAILGIGASSTTTLGSNFSQNALITIAAGGTLSLSNFVLTLLDSITNSGTITEGGSGYIRKDATNFYIADSNFDEDSGISLDNELLYLSINDEDSNKDGTSADTIASAVTVACPNDEETVSLTETGNATEVFRYTTGLTVVTYDGSATNNDGTLECSDSDTITATFTDPQDSDDTEQDTAVATTDTVPTAPSGLSGSADSSTAITWSWTDNASNEVGFKLYDATDDSLIATIATPNTTSYQETDLATATTYQRYVVSYNVAGNSSDSNTASETTSAGTPAAPSSLSASSTTAASITWGWTDNASNETGFKLYDADDDSLIATIAVANTTSYQETGLAANTTYNRYVKAYNGSGDSSASNTASGTTDASTAPNTFALISPGAGAAINDSTPTFSFYKAEDQDDGIDDITLFIDTSSYTIPGSAAEAGGTTYENSSVVVQYFNENDGNPTNDTIYITLKNALSAGSHTWYVVQTDTAGNNRESGTRSFTIDTENPGFGTLGDIVTGSQQPTIRIDVTDNHSLGELVVTLERVITVLGVPVSYTSVESSTFALSGTSSTVQYTPGSSLALDTSYRLRLVLTDTAGNEVERTITIQVVSSGEAERQEAQEAVQELDADTATVDEIIQRVRQLLPDPPFAVQELEHFAILRRQHQAQQFTAFLDQIQQQVAALALYLERSGQGWLLALLEYAGNLSDRMEAGLIALSETLREQVRLAAGGIAYGWRLAIESILNGYGRIAVWFSGLQLRLAGLFGPSDFDTLSFGIEVNIQHLVAQRRQRVQQFAEGLSYQRSRIAALFEAGQDTRVREGLRNRQWLNNLITSWWSPLQAFGTKVALVVRYNYEIIFDEEPTHITNVRITTLTPSSAVIEWDTNHLTRRGKVNYGTAVNQPYTGEVVLGSDLASHHRAEVTDLTPGTTYYFELMNQNGDYVFDAYYSLTTPEKGEITGALAPQDAEILGGEESVNIHASPDPESVVVLVSQAGEQFRALTVQGGWVSILLPSGQEGWVEINSVKLVPQQQPSATAR